MANHGKVLDPVFLGLTVRRKIHFMGKSELFKYGRSDKLLRSLGAFPVKRNKADIGALRQAVRILKTDQCLAIFPEGKVVHQEIDPKNMKNGAAFIALMAKADIIPIRIKSTYKPFRKSTIYVKDKIEIEKYLSMDRKEAEESLSREIFEKIYEEDS